MMTEYQFEDWLDELEGNISGVRFESDPFTRIPNYNIFQGRDKKPFAKARLLRERSLEVAADPWAFTGALLSQHGLEQSLRAPTPRKAAEYLHSLMFALQNPIKPAQRLAAQWISKLARGDDAWYSSEYRSLAKAQKAYIQALNEFRDAYPERAYIQKWVREQLPIQKMARGGDAQELAGAIGDALTALHDAVRIAEASYLTDSNPGAALAVQDIRRNISKSLADHQKAILRGGRRAAVKLPSEEDKGKPEHDADFEAGFTAGKAAYKKDDQVSKADADKAYKRVSRKHGDWWVKGYTAAIDMARGATSTKPAQIAKKMKLAGRNELFGMKDDVEFFFDPVTWNAQVGMGGEWWAQKLKPGTNVIRHTKERVDPGYKPVTVRVEQVGHALRFAIGGGFGRGTTFMLKLV